MATGGDDNTWGDNLNQQVLSLLETAIAGMSTVNTTGGATVLTQAQYRAALIDITGTLTSTATITLPSVSKKYKIRNSTSGAFALGIKTAAGNTVYIPQGTWADIWCDGTNVQKHTARTMAGEIFDFAGPVVPNVAYECDGSTPTRALDVDLFNALTIQTAANTSTGSPIISGIADTTNMAAGMPVSAPGIPTGSVINSKTGTTITINQNCTATAAITLVVAPWGVGDGVNTFTLPDFKTAGRFRRSRTSTLAIGTYQADAVGPHSHPNTATATTIVTASTDTQGSHSHGGITAVEPCGSRP
jgi:hypothetical protein